MNPAYFSKISWDSKVLGLNAYEVLSASEEVLQQTQNEPGHYAIKVDPLSSKALLHKYGFYYCDTLIEPFCNKTNFRAFEDARMRLSTPTSPDKLLPMIPNVFSYDRFHRDFNIHNTLADQRYENWLVDLVSEKKVFQLEFDGNPAGFFAFTDGKIVLHALSPEHRGKGLGKYFWSSACSALFDRGHSTLTSSVSAANLAVVNLYSSLGFRWKSAFDNYHKLVN